MSARDRRGIAPLVPDIVAELLSESQRSTSAVAIEFAKCERWFGAGVHYVVLIDPFARTTATWGDAPTDFPDFSTLFEVN